MNCLPLCRTILREYVLYRGTVCCFFFLCVLCWLLCAPSHSPVVYLLRSNRTEGARELAENCRRTLGGGGAHIDCVARVRNATVTFNVQPHSQSDARQPSAKPQRLHALTKTHTHARTEITVSRTNSHLSCIKYALAARRGTFALCGLNLQGASKANIATVTFERITSHSQLFRAQ